MASCIVRLVKRVQFSATILATIYLLYTWRGNDGGPGESFADDGSGIHLVVVACEGKSKRVLQETLTMIKSAIIFCRSNLHIHLFTNTLKTSFHVEFSKWPQTALQKMKLHVYPVEYPLPVTEIAELKDWWGPCASFRLFLPQLLPDVDSVLYVDADIIFLGPLDDLWEHFQYFDKNQVGALSPRVGWNFKVPSSNPNFITKPDGKLTQVNSGVFLMNLTRMREKRFASDPEISTKLYSWNWEFLSPLRTMHMKDMYGDQNLINTVFHYNPKLLYFLPCKFNYHHKFCFDHQKDRVCDSAEKDGAAVVHGSANTFYNNYSPAFAAINRAFREYAFEDDLRTYLLLPMADYLEDPSVEKHAHCGRKTELFVRHLRNSIENEN